MFTGWCRTRVLASEVQSHGDSPGLLASQSKWEAIQIPAREGQSLEQDLVQEEQGALVEQKEVAFSSRPPGATYLQEPRRVIFLDHLQAVLHQACGLAQLQCAVIDLVPNHLQRRESSEEAACEET